MPRRDDLYTNDIQNRYATLEEAGKAPLTAAQLEVLSKTQNQFYEELGILAGEDWNIGREGVVPRLFVLGPNKEYHDSILPLENMNIKPGSPEFWKEVQLGNVFAYPLGAEDPVQLQLGAAGGTPKLSYSRPVTASDLPEPPVQPVRWYHRFAHFITGGRAFDEIIKKFDYREADRESNLSKFSGMQEDRKYAFPVEKKRHEEREDQIREERIRAEKELEEKRRQAEKELAKRRAEQTTQNADAAERKHGRLKRGIEQITSVLQPVPKFDPRIEKRLEDSVAGEKQEGLYTKAQFADLEVYDKDQIDLSAIRMGKNKEPLSNEEFAAVAFFGLWDPKNAMQVYNKTAPDIWAEKSLMEMGYNKEQAGVLLTSQRRNFWSSDLFLVPPRDNEGSYFKDITNLGRKDALEAFQAYQKGDKTKLAGMIAKGINMAGSDLGTVDRPDEMTDQQKGAVAMTSIVVGLMNKDPELAEEAMKMGMDPEKLRAAKGMAEIAKIQQEREDAEYRMSQAVKKGEELPEQEKKECTLAMLKGHIAQQMLCADNQKNSAVVDEKAVELSGKMITINKFDLDKWTENPQLRPEPPKGKIYSDTYMNIIPSMAKTEMALSESLRQLGDKNGVKQLNMVADQIYGQNEYSKVSTKELFRSLNENNTKSEFKAEEIVKATTALQKQAESVKAEAVPEKNLENEIVKKPSIKDRAQMFEPRV